LFCTGIQLQSRGPRSPKWLIGQPRRCGSVSRAPCLQPITINSTIPRGSENVMFLLGCAPRAQQPMLNGPRWWRTSASRSRECPSVNTTRNAMLYPSRVFGTRARGSSNKYRSKTMLRQQSRVVRLILRPNVGDVAKPCDNPKHMPTRPGFRIRAA
jgi:hypothetical protein